MPSSAGDTSNTPLLVARETSFDSAEYELFTSSDENDNLALPDETAA